MSFAGTTTKTTNYINTTLLTEILFNLTMIRGYTGRNGK